MNTASTGCECAASYLGDAKTECKKCDTKVAEASCLCDATHSGLDCSEKKTSDANGFI
jgi:hypothetical protein